MECFSCVKCNTGFGYTVVIIPNTPFKLISVTDADFVRTSCYFRLCLFMYLEK